MYPKITLGAMRPQNLSSLLIKLSQSISNLQSPDSNLVLSYLITTVETMADTLCLCIISFSCTCKINHIIFRQSEAIGPKTTRHCSHSIQDLTGGSAQQSGHKNASLRPVSQGQWCETAQTIWLQFSETSSHIPRVSNNVIQVNEFQLWGVKITVPTT